MRRFVFTVLIICSLSASAVLISTRAQTATTAWPFIVELQPAPAAPGLYDLTVPLNVMDRSRSDLSDVRLFDAQGKEIAYAIRIRRDVEEQRAVDGTLFNQASTSELFGGTLSSIVPHAIRSLPLRFCASSWFA